MDVVDLRLFVQKKPEKSRKGPLRLSAILATIPSPYHDLYVVVRDETSGKGCRK